MRTNRRPAHHARGAGSTGDGKYRRHLRDNNGATGSRGAHASQVAAPNHTAAPVSN